MELVLGPGDQPWQVPAQAVAAGSPWGPVSLSALKRCRLQSSEDAQTKLMGDLLIAVLHSHFGHVSRNYFVTTQEVDGQCSFSGTRAEHTLLFSGW